MTDTLEGGVIRMFRLTDGPEGFGLSCDPDGLFLAGISLLSMSPAGFEPRPTSEITALIKAAYGTRGYQIRLQSSLGSIARALNSGDFALAAIAAVQTRTPELTRAAAARLVNLDKQLTKRTLTKFDPNEPRDWRGRWTTGGSAGSASYTASAGEGSANQATDRTNPGTSNPEQDATDRNALLIPVSSTESSDNADADHFHAPTSLEQEFERKYDDLGPVDFAKQVIQFGDWLGRAGANLSPEEKARALAEYSFLQNRLSFWLSYDYKPPTSQGNLISAAQTLYQGAINGGIVHVGSLPESMLAVGGLVSLFGEGPPNRVRPSATKPAFDETAAAPVQAPKEMEGVGGVVDNAEAKINWRNGIKEQNGGWEDYIANEDPGALKLRAGHPAFDHFNADTNEAISAKTLNTLTFNRINNPQIVFKKVKEYVDDAVNYEPQWKSDLDPDEIRSKTIYLAVPEHTSPEQWRQLLRAMIYGKDNGVSIVITRIRG